MPSVLLFITGVLAGVIAGFILSRMFGRRRSGDGAGEMRLLEEQLHRSDQGLEQARQQLEAQSSELKAAQNPFPFLRIACCSHCWLRSLQTERG